MTSPSDLIALTVRTLEQFCADRFANPRTGERDPFRQAIELVKTVPALTARLRAAEELIEALGHMLVAGTDTEGTNDEIDEAYMATKKARAAWEATK